MNEFHWKEQSRLDWHDKNGQPRSPELEYRLIAGAVMRVAQVAENLASIIHHIADDLRQERAERAKEKRENRKISHNMIAHMSGQLDTMEPIESLKLGVRARKTMRRCGVETIGDLIGMSADDLLKIKNFGMTSLLEVRTKLEVRSLKLKDDE